jgi:hypothetical protein
MKIETKGSAPLGTWVVHAAPSAERPAGTDPMMTPTHGQSSASWMSYIPWTFQRTNGWRDLMECGDPSEGPAIGSTGARWTALRA